MKLTRKQLSQTIGFLLILTAFYLCFDWYTFITMNRSDPIEMFIRLGVVFQTLFSIFLGIFGGILIARGVDEKSH